MYKEYPRMVYHLVHSPRVVQDSGEMARAKEEGWSEQPVEATEASMLDAKIAETETMLKELKRKRKEVK